MQLLSHHYETLVSVPISKREAQQDTFVHWMGNPIYTTLTFRFEQTEASEWYLSAIVICTDTQLNNNYISL